MGAMVEASALESLVQRLASFNEANDDEAEAVANTLSIFENMVELSPQVLLRTRGGAAVHAATSLLVCRDVMPETVPMCWEAAKKALTRTRSDEFSCSTMSGGTGSERLLAQEHPHMWHLSEYSLKTQVHGRSQA